MLCAICKQVFTVTKTNTEAKNHAASKHSSSTFAQCFPSIAADMEAEAKAAADATANASGGGGGGGSGGGSKPGKGRFSNSVRIEVLRSHPFFVEFGCCATPLRGTIRHPCLLSCSCKEEEEKGRRGLECADGRCGGWPKEEEECREKELTHLRLPLTSPLFIFILADHTY